jgi:Pin2-interacting protein X1
VQKLNLLGVGNGQGSLNNPDAIAYKQNNDFEKMLKRLNQSGGSDSNDEAMMQEEKDEKLARIVMQGFVPADKTDAEHAGVQPQEEDIEMAEVDKKSEKERRREEKRRKKQQQKGQEESSSLVPQPQSQSDSTMTPPVVTVPDATSSKPRMAYVPNMSTGSRADLLP